MCKFIGIESVIANALIEKMIENGNYLSLKQIKDYGYEVINSLETKTNERVILIYEQNSIDTFLINYSNYFAYEIVEGNECIKVKDGVEIEDLLNIFRWPLSIELMESFSENKNILFR